MDWFQLNVKWTSKTCLLIEKLHLEWTNLNEAVQIANGKKETSIILEEPMILFETLSMKTYGSKSALAFISNSYLDDVWKVHRKSLNYSFNLKILQSFIPIFIENSEKLVNDLSVNVGKAKEFDMLTYTTKSALNMICGRLSCRHL